MSDSGKYSDSLQDNIAAARIARMHSTSSMSVVTTKDTNALAMRKLYVAVTNFRGMYPKISDTAIAEAWKACTVDEPKKPTIYSAKSVQNALINLKSNSPRSSNLYPAIANHPDTFFAYLEKQSGYSITEKDRTTLLAAVSEVVTTLAAIKSTPSR